ncbi:MAG: leucine-rich repeat domain-containing protein [Lentisphaerae bacterium]|nr:leucine-rich repeat domain-containing protein [Lentisphaerota bacterium]
MAKISIFNRLRNVSTGVSMFAFVCALLASAATVQAATLTVRNFDEDLATVHVNGAAVTNGGTVEVSGQVTLELAEFRHDYYFAYAPGTQTNRTLALARWEGLPGGASATANPVTINVTNDLTITPNIDCQGYVWVADDARTAMTDCTWTMSMSGLAPNTRTVKAVAYTAYTSGAKVMDFAKRVDYKGTNYTVVAFTSRNAFKNSGLNEMRLPKRFNQMVFAQTDGGGFNLTNIVGLADCAMTSVPGYGFFYGAAAIAGPMVDYIPRGVKSIGENAYCNKSALKGALPLPTIVNIDNSAFSACTGVTELYSESPVFTTIGSYAFRNCTGLKKITLASPALSSVAPDAFTGAAAITNLTYLSAPPASFNPVDNLLRRVANVDGDHACTMHVPLTISNWWKWVSAPSANEVAAGLPAGCAGVYVTEADERKAWIVSTDDLSSCLLETDMAMVVDKEYAVHSNLTSGAQMTLSRAGFTSCQLQHFNPATGAWETFETRMGDSFTYTHDGHLTRAIWLVEGAVLTLSSSRYGGTFTVTGPAPILGDNVYALNSVLTITAHGADERPTSHFSVWSSGVSGDDAANATITVTMDSDKTLVADFDPDEWLYDPVTQTISDREWTSSKVTLDAVNATVSVGDFYGGQNNVLWLDLSLPVHVPSQPETDYVVTKLTTARNSHLIRIRVGPRFSHFVSDMFRGSTVLDSIEGLGESSLTVFPWCTFHDISIAPIITRVYEANDFIPPTLVAVEDYFYSGGPTLVGTLRLPNFKTFTQDNRGFNDAARLGGVTNLMLTCKDLTEITYNMFVGMRLQEVTIGSTNFTSSMSNPFSGSVSTMERMIFLAHAPDRTALDNVLSGFTARTTPSAIPLLLHCSRYAPGWREMGATLDRASAEWQNRPDDTWGIYETAAGKRYYLIQRASEYDKLRGMVLILK